MLNVTVYYAYWILPDSPENALAEIPGEMAATLNLSSQQLSSSNWLLNEVTECAGDLSVISGG